MTALRCCFYVNAEFYCRLPTFFLVAGILDRLSLGMAVASWWGWSIGAGLIFGLSLSCASTVVLLKALESRGILDSMNGRIAVGWLVVEDLAIVLVLVLLPPLAGVLGGTVVDQGGASIGYSLGKTLLLVSGFVAVMLIAGRRILPWMLLQVAKTGSRELFTLAVIATAIGIAYGAAALFSVSFALSAFFAGMVMRESDLGHRATSESLPLRDAFAVLFFVSVGMLFDPQVLIDEPLHVLAVVAIIVFGKTLAAAALVLAFRYPLNTALTVAASLAQIGEFSFILAGLGLSLGLMPPEGVSLVLAGVLISIALNPVMFGLVKPFKEWALRRSSFARKLEHREDPLAVLPMSAERKYLEGQVVVVGHGRVGRRICGSLARRNIPFVVVEQNREYVEKIRSEGVHGQWRLHRPGHPDPGAHQQRGDAGDRHPRPDARAAHGGNRPHAQPGHRSGDPHPQPGRGGHLPQGQPRPGVLRRGRTGAQHEGVHLFEIRAGGRSGTDGTWAWAVCGLMNQSGFSQLP